MEKDQNINPEDQNINPEDQNEELKQIEVGEPIQEGQEDSTEKKGEIKGDFP